MNRVFSSFRDNNGHVYRSDNGEILRAIYPQFAADWNRFIDGGLAAQLTAKGDLVPFQETAPLPDSWKTVSAEKIPFITYPYEWCFSQLRDAAFLTLDMQEKALAKKMILKDASVYNVQFKGAKPVFIDLLSFENRDDETPWQAYRQFCMHFLAPLALLSYRGPELGIMQRLWIDGIPLAVAAKLLPWTARLRFGLLWNIFMHAGMEQKHGDSKKAARKANAVSMKTSALDAIAKHLKSTIAGLKAPAAKTEWSDYYNDTNYTPAGMAFKSDFVGKAAAANGGKLALDLGANTGVFSKLLAPHYDTVVAADVDVMAVEQHYRALKKNGPANIVPIVLDLSNPSPALGWACAERESFFQRGPMDLVVALAVIHHIRVSLGVPMRMIAALLARMIRPEGTLILEFVPKGDSQMQRLLSVRKDIFDDYELDAMREAFAEFFVEAECAHVPDSSRTLHVMRRTPKEVAQFQ